MFSITIISSLLSFAYSDVNTPNIYGVLPLQEAASKGDEDDCHRLINLGAKVGGRDNRDKTALHVAAYYGHTSVCELLSDNGVPIDALDVDGESALHHAAAGGYGDICRLMRARGANIYLSSRYSGTPLDVARRRNEDGSHADVIECLLQDSNYAKNKRNVFAPTRHPDDCGSHNGAQCQATASSVVWKIGDTAWSNFKAPNAKCESV